MLFGVVLLENAGMSQEKMMSGWQRMLLQNVYITCCITGALTDVQVTHAMGTDITPYHDRCWLLDLTLITAWMLTRWTTKHDFTVLLSISDETEHREVSGSSGQCLCMASALHSKAICGYSSEWCSPTMVYQSIPEPMSVYRNMTVLETVMSEEFDQIHWIFLLYCVLKKVKCPNSYRFVFRECCSQTVGLFDDASVGRLASLEPSLLLMARPFFLPVSYQLLISN